MQTLDNTGTQRQLYFRDRHRVWIGGERDLLRHSNAIEICYGTWSRTERSWHSLGRSSVGWFNPAATTRIESRKPTIDIEFTRPVLLTIHGLFLPVVHIKPTVHNQTVQIRLRYTCPFGTQLWSHLHVYKEDLNPRFCFGAKRANELDGEL